MENDDLDNDCESVDDVSDVSDVECDDMEENVEVYSASICDDLQFVAQIAQEAMADIESRQCNDTVEDCVELDSENMEAGEFATIEVESSSDEDDEESCGIGAGDSLLDLAEEEDDTMGAAGSGPLRTKHEITEDEDGLLAESLSVTEIPSSEGITLIGEVLYHIAEERSIVIQSVPTSEPLDEGSVLCLSDKTPIGKIHEIFGPLSQPFYVVKSKSAPGACAVTSTNTDMKIPRTTASTTASAGDSGRVVKDEETACVEVLNGIDSSRFEPDTAEHPPPVKIESETRSGDISSRIVVGLRIFAPTGSSAFVTPLSLQTVIQNNRRGTDASNLFDEEIAEEDQEFSDDESELAFKRQKAKKGKAKRATKAGISQQPSLQPHTQHTVPYQQQHQQFPTQQQYGHFQFPPQSGYAAPTAHIGSYAPPPPVGPPPIPQTHSFPTYPYAQQQMGQFPYPQQQQQQQMYPGHPPQYGQYHQQAYAYPSQQPYQSQQQSQQHPQLPWAGFKYNPPQHPTGGNK